MICCKGCPDRTPECHADCERYKEYKAWLTDRNNTIHKNRQVDNFIAAYSKAKSRRLKRTKG